jgi:photosynthetic reaction center H subunit
MKTGAVTGYIDVAQLVLYAFWIFFAGLIIYLRREDKREGYPLESDRSGGRIRVQGFPAIPAPKTFRLSNGDKVMVPAEETDTREIKARPAAAHHGAPLVPTGDPMLDAVGPASYVLRGTHPEHTLDGRPNIVPMRLEPAFKVADGDPDPRGWDVMGADGRAGGTVSELWVDRAEPQIRYFEVQVGARRVLLPANMATVNTTLRHINVASILGSQFANVPAHASSDHVTLREEDQITAYWASGHLYATPARSEPLL